MDNKSMDEVKNRLEKLMESKDMSMGALSYVTDIPKTTISRYIKDPGTIPTDRLSVIAEALNVTPEYLMGWATHDQTDNLYGDHIANLEYLNDKPELLDIYKEIHDSNSLQLLFDQARDLTPADLETVLMIIKGIKNERNT